MDSLAVWHPSPSFSRTPWLIATAKATDALLIYDAATGSLIRRHSPSEASAKMSRPNGVAKLEGLDVICVIERDGHRAQLLGLPDLDLIATFGEAELKRPYGLSVLTKGVTQVEGGGVQREYEIFVTDNYIREIEKVEAPKEGETEEEQDKRKSENRKRKVPPSDLLFERVKKFKITIETSSTTKKQQHRLIASKPDNHFVQHFGEVSGPGVLHKVESILVDPFHQTLLIADEIEHAKNVKVYWLNGTFTGTIIGTGIFEHEPEGIALYDCPHAPGKGYIVMTDQHRRANRFFVFDRETYELRGAFMGHDIANTDGITLTQVPFAGKKFRNGAFYAVHADGSVGAIAWHRIAKVLKLELTCDLEAD